MTSKLVVNTIEADTGISSVSFASSISMNSTAKFHFSAAGIDIGADTNIDRPAAGVLGFNINDNEKIRIDSNGRLLLGTVKTYGTGPYYDDICINNSNGSGSAGGAGIDLISKSDNYGALVFSNESQHERGYVKFEHNSGINKLRFGTLGTDRWEILSTGHLLPSTNNVFDIGSSSQRVRNGYFDDLTVHQNLGVGNTTTVGRNAGVSTATGALIYNTTTNALEVYNGSSWLSVTSKVGTFNISYLVVGGGGAGGGNYRGGGGGAGALRTNWNNETQGGGTSSGSAKSINIGTSYAIGVGTAGVGRGGTYGWSGATSTFDDIVSKGGGGGGRYNTTSGDEDGRSSADPGGGSGGGGGGGQASSSTGVGGASGTYGYNGGNGSPTGGAQCGGGGGGAGAVGVLGGGGGTSGDGGTKVSNTITGSSVDYAGGGGGGNYENGNTTIGGGAGAGNGGRGTGTAGQAASIANRGSGGGGAGGAGGGAGGAGSAGVIILRFPSTYTATLSGGVASSSATVGTDTVLTITSTTGSETVTFS